MIKIRKRHVLLPLVIGFFVYLLFSVYEEVKQRTIDDFNAQQMILAKQAAKGIQSFFRHNYLALTYLAGIDAVVLANRQGNDLLTSFYSSHSDNIKAITLTSAAGKIIHTVPFNLKAIGTDISYQAHVQAIMRTHKPVISDVFMAVQGYQAVAYHVPLLKDGVYQGSLAILIPFNSLAREHLMNIRIGKSGHAWVISEQGVELFCPIPGHSGKLIEETTGDHPAIAGMAERMMQGNSGMAQYRSDKTDSRSADLSINHAAFYPVDLGNTHWSIAVTTPEDEILSTMKGFRNKMVIVIFLLSGVSIIYLFSAIRSWNIIRAESKRKAAEQALQESAKKHREILEGLNDAAYRMSLPEGRYEYMSKSARDVFGYEAEEWMTNPLLIQKIIHPDYTGYFAEKWTDLINGRVSQTYEYKIIGPDGRDRLILQSNTGVFDEGNHIIAIEGLCRDITRQKEAEDQIKASLREKEILLHEIHHRVKNNMAVISSLLSLQMNSTDNMQTREALRDSQNRVQTMSLIHESLYHLDDLAIIDMQDYLSKLGDTILRGYSLNGKVLIQVEAENTRMGVKQATPIGLIANELITNALKYAFPDGRAGEIIVRLQDRKDTSAELMIADNGIGVPDDFSSLQSHSLGLKLVHSIAELQLDGSINLEKGQGTRWRIQFTIDEP
ncbi:MAG: histidine kinase dimerization/phosphoacceptor domain -containing protein [bacterium]